MLCKILDSKMIYCAARAPTANLDLVCKLLYQGLWMSAIKMSAPPRTYVLPHHGVF